MTPKCKKLARFSVIFSIFD